MRPDPAELDALVEKVQKGNRDAFGDVVILCQVGLIACQGHEPTQAANVFELQGHRRRVFCQNARQHLDRHVVTADKAQLVLRRGAHRLWCLCGLQFLPPGDGHRQCGLDLAWGMTAVQGFEQKPLGQVDQSGPAPRFGLSL